jgi:hypothetical protein
MQMLQQHLFDQEVKKPQARGLSGSIVLDYKNKGITQK